MDWQPAIETSSPVSLKRRTGKNADTDEKATICLDADVQQRVVDISFCESTPLLWRTAEIKTAREEVGVVGSLVGSLARQPRQNVRLGRPLELLHEEARLLSVMGRAAAVKHLECLSEAGRAQAVQHYQAALERSYEEQTALALQEKQSVLLRVITQKQNGDSSSERAEWAVREQLDSLPSDFSFPRVAMTLQLATARTGLSLCPLERSFLATDWPLSQDERSETRFLVYRDLRQKGFYLTSAGKFGGDYLVYPGDPHRFHAHFIALCVSKDAEMPLCDVLSIARLGSNVKKTVLLCSPDTGAEGGVVYSSLQWSGMV